MICIICKKIFQSSRNRPAKYCSRICIAERRKKGVYKNCFVCQQKFYVSLATLKRKNRGKFCSKKCFYFDKEHYKNITGKNHYLWNGGSTKKSLLIRDKFIKTIRKKVLVRDNYTCQMCGEKGGYLHVDHIQSWAEYVELRFSMDNCRTLCRNCHYKITFDHKIPKNNMWGIKPRNWSVL